MNILNFEATFYLDNGAVVRDRKLTYEIENVDWTPSDLLDWADRNAPSEPFHYVVVRWNEGDYSYMFRRSKRTTIKRLK